MHVHVHAGDGGPGSTWNVRHRHLNGGLHLRDTGAQTLLSGCTTIRGPLQLGTEGSQPHGQRCDYLFPWPQGHLGAAPLMEDYLALPLDALHLELDGGKHVCTAQRHRDTVVSRRRLGAHAHAHAHTHAHAHNTTHCATRGAARRTCHDHHVLERPLPAGVGHDGLDNHPIGGTGEDSQTFGGNGARGRLGPGTQHGLDDLDNQTRAAGEQGTGWSERGRGMSGDLTRSTELGPYTLATAAQSQGQQHPRTTATLFYPEERQLRAAGRHVH
jgi:hypothetical protein